MAEQRKKVLMKCGHVSNSWPEVGGKRIPSCVICAGKPDARIVAEDQPDLTGRQAKCQTCGAIDQSSLNLAFFEYHPDKPFDGYYCGCHGWG